MSTKTIILGVIGSLILIIGFAFLLTAGQKPVPETKTYSSSSSDRPIAQTPDSLYDFGEIKVSDVKQKDFVLKNAGLKPLQILNINSSCNCTFGQLIYNNKESKKFGMHAQSGYVADIAPGTQATVRVTYEPSLMPVFGTVEREVYLTTNDPQKDRLIFAIKATVK